MIIENHQAWLLHKIPSGDSSLKLVLFSREKGLIKATWRGGRTPKKQVQAQAFTPLWVALAPHREWHYVNQLENAGPSLTLTGLSLFAGLYLNELLVLACPAHEPQTELFEVYQITLQALAAMNDKRAVETLLRRFEMSFLQACGYFLTLTQDIADQPIQPSDCYLYTPGMGFEKAEKGLLGNDILAFADLRFEDERVLKTAKWIMRRAIDQLLGGRALNTRQLWK